MLTLITPEDVEFQRSCLLELFNTYSLNIKIDPTLRKHSLFSSNVEANFIGSSPKLVDYVTKFLEQHETTSLMQRLKPEYLFVLIGMSAVFGKHLIKDLERPLEYPSVEWQLETPSGILTNNTYSYIGSEYRYYNPEKFVLSTRTEHGFLFRETAHTVVEARRALAVSLPLFEDTTSGFTTIFAKVSPNNGLLSVFYSIAERSINIPNLSMQEDRERSPLRFDVQNLMGSLVSVHNPTVRNPTELVSEIFFTDRDGHPKVSFLGLPK